MERLFAYDSLGDQTLAEFGVGTPQQSNSEDYYDGDGNLTLSIDGDGNSSSYLYDGDGNETLAIQGYGSSAASTSSYAYDAAGEQTLAVTGYGTPAAESTFYAYDANGNQTLTITGYNSSKPEITVALYDGDGNLTQQIDPDGDTSDFAYDSLGDQTLSVLGAGTPQAASSHDYYDGDDNLTLSVDADGDSTSYLYDADGNNTLMIEGVGTSSASTTSMAYDSDGDNTLMIEGVGTSAASTTSMAYDAAGNQTLAITGYNSSKPETTIARYDGDGNLTQEVDADGDTSDFAYDALGDQTLEVAGAGSTDPGSTSDFYDGDGNLTLTVNPVGDSTSYQYDADGNQTLEIDGFDSSSAATIHYLYDASGNQTQEVDPDGNTTSWQYDADGDQTLMIQAYGTSAAATTSYEYDNDGNQTLQINPNGTSITSSYDADGNLSSETWYNANGSVANSSSYTYDGDGNILTAGNDAGTYTFGYNTDGEQTLVVNPNGVTLNYQYDADGNATEISDSLGDTVTSQYDADGDLIAQGYSGPNGAQLLVELGYDDDGNLTSISRYSDLAGTQLVGTSSYAYNAQGDVSSIVHSNASDTTLDSFNYSYDAADELTQQVANGTTTAYSYDATGQLTSAGTAAYSYDANGNPDDSGDSVGPNNELLSDGTWNYSYDANGNMIGKTGVASGPDAGLTWAYAYDPGNELISAIETNSQGQTLVQETITYDVFGDVLATSLSTNGGSPVVTHYVYNGSTLWTTTNASNVPEDFYLSGDQADQYFAQYDASNGAAWYLNNNLGSVCTTMSNSGAAIDNIVYDADGNVVSQSNSAQQPLPGFTGLLTFAALGIDAADVRDYDLQSGQWMQQDPDLLTPGPNPREYVDDEPTNATDPTGMWLKLTKDQVAPVEKYFGQPNISQEDIGGGYSRIKITNSAKAGVNLSRYVQRTNSTVSAREKAINFGMTVLEAAEAEKDFTWEEVVNQYRSQKGVEAAASAPAPSQGQRYSTGPSGTRRSVYVPGRGMRTVDERNQLVTPYNLPAPSDDGGILPKFLASNEFQQSLCLAGGGASVVSGVILLATPGGQVFGVILIGSGLDDVQASVRSLKGGKHIDSLRHDVAVKVAVAAGLDEKKGAQVVGFIADVGIPVAAELQIGRISTLGKLSKIEKGGEEVKALGKLGRAANAEVKVCTVVNSCFAAGTPLLTPNGSKLIEQFQPGDWVLSRSEYDPDSPLTAKVVEAVFKRVGRILHLHVGGQVIRTTTEHPFWVYNQGWLMASQLRVGDLLVSHDGQVMPIEDLLDTGEYETVYNLRIADYHTYFVGSQEWGFSVWSHNAVCSFASDLAGAGVSKAAARRQYFRIKNLPEAEREAAFRSYLQKKLPGVSSEELEAAVSRAMAPELTGTKGGVRANQIGQEGESVASRYYGPKNNETWEVEGFETGAKPDYVLESDLATGRPKVVVDAKNMPYYYLSTQIKKYLRLVGEDGVVIVAVPKSGAKVSEQLLEDSRILIAPVLPPK